MHGKVSEFRKNSSSISYWESSDPIIKKTVVCRDHPTLKKKRSSLFTDKVCSFLEWMAGVDHMWIAKTFTGPSTSPCKRGKDYRKYRKWVFNSPNNSTCLQILLSAANLSEKEDKKRPKNICEESMVEGESFLCCFFLLVCASRVRNSLKEVWHFIIAQNTRFYLEPFKTLLLHFIISANCILIRFMSVFTFWW